jgi:outer membrane immunogenic protein
MTKLLVATAASIALVAAPAFAADMSMPVKAPIMLPPPPVANWTGFYLGGNAGYLWTDNNSINTVSAPGACSAALVGCLATPNYSATSAQAATFSLPVKNSGFIGGGQFGYNWQFNSLVTGLEADIQGVSGSNGSSAGGASVPNPNFAGFPVVQTESSSRQLNYIGTVRARLGVLATPTFLLYATGGLAYGGVNASTSISQNVLNCAGAGTSCPGASSGSFSQVLAGYTVGAGVEWMFSSNWTAKVEYLYYDLGNASFSTGTVAQVSSASGLVLGSSTGTSTTRFNGDFVRAGVNYKF